MRALKSVILITLLNLPILAEVYPAYPWTYTLGYMPYPMGIETFEGRTGGLAFGYEDATYFRRKFEEWGNSMYYPGQMQWGWANLGLVPPWINPNSTQLEHRIKFFTGHIIINPPGNQPDPRVQLWNTSTNSTQEVRILDPNYYGKNQLLFLSGCNALRQPDPNYYRSMFANANGATTTPLHAVYGHAAQNFEYEWRENGVRTGGSWDVWSPMWSGFFWNNSLGDCYFNANRIAFYDKIGRGIMPATVYRYGWIQCWTGTTWVWNFYYGGHPQANRWYNGPPYMFENLALWHMQKIYGSPEF